MEKKHIVLVAWDRISLSNYVLYYFHGLTAPESPTKIKNPIENYLKLKKII